MATPCPAVGDVLNPRTRRPNPPRSVVCSECGETFTTSAPRACYCSPECRAVGRRRTTLAWRRGAGAESRRATQKRDKARRRGATRAARIDPLEVFARDGWTCQLCGDPVDPEIRAPDPRSPSLDHVVPLALGGAHELANLQLAHFGCNARKGAREAVAA